MDVQMHDGSHLRIRKLDRDYDPTNRLAAGAILEEAEAKGEVLTGVLYVNTVQAHFHRPVEPDGRADRDPAGVQNPAVAGGPGPGDGRVALIEQGRRTRQFGPNLRLLSAPVSDSISTGLSSSETDCSRTLWLHALLAWGFFLLAAMLISLADERFSVNDPGLCKRSLRAKSCAISPFFSTGATSGKRLAPRSLIPGFGWRLYCRMSLIG